MAGVHLAVKVQQLLLTPDTDEQGLYCVLSTGSTRFTTSKASAAAELFLVSPWELSHAAKKPLPVSPSTQHDHSKPLNSPVLTVELVSSKRWGADAVLATGEVLLGPLLEQLKPNGPKLDVKVYLARSSNKAGSKPSRSTSNAAAAAAGSSAMVDAAAVGPDTQAVVLQFSTVMAPSVPENLLGPVGSGKAEVPPRFCADAAWLDWQQPVLHTGAGHVYLAPTVQLMRITLHKAQGLHNLHVDPVAAAAAAAAIGRMAATGSSPSRADRAKTVAERAMLDSTRAGRNLLQQTSSWFKRSKSAAGLQSGKSFLAPSKSSAGVSARNAASSGTSVPQPPAATATPAWFPASADGGAAGSAAQVPSPSDPEGASGPPDTTQHPAADAAAVQMARSSSGKLASAGLSADGPGSPRSLKHSLSGGSNSSGSSAGQRPIGVAPLAQSPHGVTAPPGQAVVQAATKQAEVAAAEAVPAAEEAAGDAFASLAADLADPVSVLKHATQHTRKVSVDAEAVMAALEENGFHATDAPGGAFFYTRITLVGVPDASGSSSASVGGSSSSHCSRVVGLSPSGEASWDQGFWVPVVRPAPANAALELELFAAKDDKTRGKSVAVVRAPLQQLLPLEPTGQQAALPHHQAGSAFRSSSKQQSNLPWARASHVLQASFSDHLHCSFAVTVEVADWDLRAQLAGIPRTIKSPAAAAAAAAEPPTTTHAAAATSAAAEAAGAAAAADRDGAPARVGSGSPGTPPAGSSPGGSPRSSGQMDADEPVIAAAMADALPDAEARAAGAASAVAEPAGPGRGVPAGPPPVAALDLVVKAFDTQKPLDVFFVLLLGPYCLVSSTSHSTHHHHWGWHLKLPLDAPADTLTLALLAREDQAGGRKRVGAAMLTLFSSSIKLVGKMRIRLSTLPANVPLNLSMPLQGERTNLRAGQACAATAHLYLQLVVPNLLGRYLPAYARFSVCSPALYLLSTSPAVAGPDSTLEALAGEVQATTARWVEQQPPQLPAKVFRKVQDSGRGEFTLSRTRSNWRRLMLLRDATAPARAAFSHLCSWDNAWHSGGWYCVILLFGVYPSKVLSVMLLLLVVALLRKAMRPSQASAALAGAAAGAAATAAGAGAAAAAAGSGSAKGAKPSAGGTTAAALAGGAAAAAAVIAGGSAGHSWRMLPVVAPPVMWDPAYASPDDAQQSGTLPTDPYTSLKQNYEAVIGFLTLVQNVIDGWASAGEGLQLAFSWTDPLATAVLVVVMLLLALGLWVLGLQVLVTAGLLWMFRHPILRTPLPPPPVNFVWSLPTRSDTML